MQLLPLTFTGVTKKYGTKSVLEDVNFSINSGEFISILGNSGAGKSTIIRLLLAIEKPTAGEIVMGGAHESPTNSAMLRGDALAEYRRSIGVVFQDCKLLPSKTVFENIAFPLEACHFPDRAVVENTQEALGKIGITHLQDQYPDELSGGEAQRVALARAIVHKPRLILADEPTGHLDAESAALVLKNLITINMDGTAIILFTHNHPLTKLTGQKVYRLESGHLRALPLP